MNSYNENLHTAVVSALRNQEIKLEKSKESCDHIMMSLYYAQGDYKATAEKLQVANERYDSQKKVLSQLVINSNI